MITPEDQDNATLRSKTHSRYLAVLEEFTEWCVERGKPFTSEARRAFRSHMKRQGRPPYSPPPDEKAKEGKCP